jgi:putative flippase GtrA
MLAVRPKTRASGRTTLSRMSRLADAAERAGGPSGQFLRFCLVGASGYAVNLAVYAALLEAGLAYSLAATASFLVAATSNYVWNRLWTFRARQARVLSQGVRALSVSVLSLGANQLFLYVFVAAGAGRLAGQAVAILLVTPFSFAGNKLWAFAGGGRRRPAAVNAAES